MSIRANNYVIQWIAYEQAYLCDVGEILGWSRGSAAKIFPEFSLVSLLAGGLSTA